MVGYYINPNGTLPLNSDGNPALINISQRNARCCCEHPCGGIGGFSCCEVLESYLVTMRSPATQGSTIRCRFNAPFVITAGEFPHFGISTDVELWNNRTQQWYRPAPGDQGPFSVLVSLERPRPYSDGCFWEMVVAFGLDQEIGAFDYARFEFRFPVEDLTNKPPVGVYNQLYGSGVIELS